MKLVLYAAIYNNPELWNNNVLTILIAKKMIDDHYL